MQGVFLSVVQEAVRHKRPELWHPANSLLLHNSGLAYWSTLVTDCLAKRSGPALPVTLCMRSAPVDYSLFSWWKKLWRDTDIIPWRRFGCLQQNPWKRPQKCSLIKVPPLAEVYDNIRRLLWKWNTVDIPSTQGKKATAYTRNFFYPTYLLTDGTVMQTIWLSAHSLVADTELCLISISQYLHNSMGIIV
jgi:hypothetical protein